MIGLYIRFIANRFTSQGEYMKRVLTIAGSDSGGGAGIQADLKTFTAFGVFGMSVITAITAQNTCGVLGIEELSLDIIEKQLKAVITDIGTDAVKTGMLANSQIVQLVADTIKRYNLDNVVIDPVMIAKSGDSLLSQQAVKTIKEHLIPLATVITPNLPEAESLLGYTIESEEEMIKAAVDLHKLGSRVVVIKGGHLLSAYEEGTRQAIDVIYDGSNITTLRNEFIDSRNTHGTGCTYASAIAAGLAKGYSFIKAIKSAKTYITKAIKTAPDLGKGHGPVDHQADSVIVW